MHQARKRGHVSLGKDVSGLSRHDHVWSAADSITHNARNAARHRLIDDQAPGFRSRWQYQHIRSDISACDLRLIEKTSEADRSLFPSHKLFTFTPQRTVPHHQTRNCPTSCRFSYRAHEIHGSLLLDKLSRE